MTYTKHAGPTLVAIRALVPEGTSAYNAVIGYGEVLFGLVDENRC